MQPACTPCLSVLWPLLNIFPNKDRPTGFGGVHGDIAHVFVPEVMKLFHPDAMVGERRTRGQALRLLWY
jgi:hypothetical protein